MEGVITGKKLDHGIKGTLRSVGLGQKRYKERYISYVGS